MTQICNHMTQKYDIRIQQVHDYNEFVGTKDLHSHISVIHYDELPPIRHSRMLWGVYGLFLLEDEIEQLTYGSGTYDYSEGSLVCVAPSQIGGVADDGTTFQRKGWALLFNSELFHTTNVEKKLPRLEFFRYHVNKALVITHTEQQHLKTLFQMLRDELETEKRKEIIIQQTELILAYCSAFFNRQYSLESGGKSKHIVSRLEHVLDDYYTTEKQYAKGLPTVRYCADALCVAPNYLGDLIRQETGDSAIHFIGRNIIRRAKDLLMSGKSITETAYELGFDYPSHLSRLFNRIEGVTPSAYIKKHHGASKQTHE